MDQFAEETMKLGAEIARLRGDLGTMEKQFAERLSRTTGAVAPHAVPVGDQAEREAARTLAFLRAIRDAGEAARALRIATMVPRRRNTEKAHIADVRNSLRNYQRRELVQIKGERGLWTLTTDGAAMLNSAPNAGGEVP